MFLRTSLIVLAALALAPGAAHAAKSYDNCTGFIDSLPATISTQGTWCLRNDLATPMTSGKAIQVTTNNVVIDCNGFKVGNLQAGASTQAYGIFAQPRLAITVRDCNLRGFLNGIFLSGGNHLVENNRVEATTARAITIDGDGSIVRGNAIQDIGNGLSNAYGVYSFGSVDIYDNTVSGLNGAMNAIGINTSSGDGTRISGNRVRNLTATVVAIGIKDNGSTGMAVRNNYLFDDAGTTGIECTAGHTRVQGNTVQGFASGMSASCGDAGRNDFTP